jgi:polar amino acid transport system substrate-binding protein
MSFAALHHFLVVFAIGLCAGLASVASQPLTVGVYDCPPFVIRDEAGAFRGLSIFLSEQIAVALGRDFQIVERNLPALLDDARAGRIDVGVSCISITPEREELLDFSHSFYETHLAIAVRHPEPLEAIIAALTNRDVLLVLAAVLAAASLVGAVYYMLEHRLNPKLYSRETRAGRFVEGFILGLLSITRGPVNYYEFKTLAGRVLTVLLAVATTVFIASFTAIMASAFTVDRLRSDIRGPNDLSRVAVGVKGATTSEAFLLERAIPRRAFVSTADALDALARGEIDAVVGDDPVLRYEIRRGREGGRFGRIEVLPHQFERQNYALVLPDESPLVEGVNRALLATRESPQWRRALELYLGLAP